MLRFYVHLPELYMCTSCYLIALGATVLSVDSKHLIPLDSAQISRQMQISALKLKYKNDILFSMA